MLKRRSFLLGLTAALLLVATSAGAGEGAESAVNAYAGAFETSVPIGAPGFLGLEPQLSLQYRSTGGNGMLGVGWALGGFSGIERTSPGGGSPRYDANDVYYLDGNLLLPCAQAASSPSCTTGGTHATRMEMWARVKYVSGSNTWEVTKRDGTKMTYVALYDAGPGIFRYALSSVVDKTGNTVSYAYWCDPGADCYPDAVSYNGAQIKLYWELRPDPIMFATGSGMGRTNYRLKTVDVVVNGGRARSYKLSYAAAGAPPQSKLASVQQFGRDATLDGSGTVTGGSALPAMTMTYDGVWNQDFVRTSGTHGWDFGYPPSTSYTTTQGDFNGDGKTDVAVIQGTGINLLTSNGTGGFTSQWFAFNGWNFGSPPSAGYTLVTGDFNGDGKTDIDLLGATTHHLMLSNGNGTFALSQPSYPGWDFGTPISNTYTLAVGDFNGDGKTDIDLLGATNHYVMFSNGDGSFSYTAPSYGGWNFGSPPHNGYTLAMGDFNGDGKTDIDLLGASNHHLMLSNGDGTFANSGPAFAWTFTTPIPLYYTVATGDFNGDGRTDIDVLGATNHYLMLSNGGGTFTYSAPSYGGWNFGSPPSGYGPRPTVAATWVPQYGCPLNGVWYGDNNTCLANCHSYPACNLGAAQWVLQSAPQVPDIHEWWLDITHRFDSECASWATDKYGNQTCTETMTVHRTSVCNLGADYLWADPGNSCSSFQSPWCSDLPPFDLWKGQCNSNTVMSLSGAIFEGVSSLYIRMYECPIAGYGCNSAHNCDVPYACQESGYYSCPAGYGLSGTTCYGPQPRSPYTLAMGDYNGDGRTDINLVYKTVNYIMLSNGDGTFTNASPSQGGWDFGVPPDASFAVLSGDFDGDGKTDFTMLGGPYYYMSRAGAGSARLVTVNNGLGGSSTITYEPSSKWSDNVLPEGVVFPTVSAVTISNGAGDSQTTTYTYQGARWQHATAADPVKSFLGFRKATTTMSATGAYSETYYWQRAGTIAKPEVVYKRRADGAILSFDRISFTENAAPPYTSLMTEGWGYECNGDAVFDGNGNYVSGCRRVALTYAYDQYGGITEERHYGDYDVTGDERTIARSFAPNTASYIVGLPAWENVYAGIGTGGALLSSTRYYYDGATATATAPTTGLLTKKGQWNDQSGGEVAHTFAYDSHGRETAATDPLGRSVTRTYSAAGLVTAIADPLGRTVQTSWDPVLGTKLTETDVNGQVTTHAYDAFGRGTLTTKADGTVTKVEHLDYGTTNRRVRTSTLLPGNQWVWEDAYFDGLGRPNKVVSSTGVTAETIYGPSGHAWKQSLPYVSGETVRWEIQTRDEIGRVLTTTLPDGAVISRSYGDWSVVVTDPSGNARTSWYDAFKRVTKIREVIGGTNADTSFYYDQMGRRTKSVDALGKQTLVSFDSLGRSLQKSDPDQGLWRYGYDLVGRLTAETDALNEKTTLGYDALGRVTRRTYANGSHDDYTFDETGRGAAVGRLTTAVSASGVTSRAWYDLMGRRTRHEQVVDGQTYVMSHAYDAAGRLSTATYPDGEVVTYSYGTSGMATGKLVGMAGNVAGSLLSNVGYTTRGQVAALTYGNGVTTTTTYDAIGERVTSLQIGSLATITYGYDSLGRMTSQASAQLKSTNWTYGYDSIGRLTRATNLNYGAYSSTYRYDVGGRILCSSETGMGAYTYGDPAHPHAVTVAGGQTYAYDANGNMVSGAGRTLAYDKAHRPVTITSGGLTTTMVYDAQGVRVKKSSASGTVVYVGGVYELRGAQVVKHYLAGALRVAKRDANGTSFVHTDHLGSTRLLTNASGQEVQHYDHTPYGRLFADSAGIGDTRRYAGHESDDETGLMFFQARYYDPALGRFVQPDSFLSNMNNPQDLDLYAYANNNPISYIDPSGHGFLGAIIAFVWSCVQAAAVYIAAHIIEVGLLVVGTALTYTKSPILQTIGMVMGAVGGAMLGGPLMGCGTGAVFTVGGVGVTSSMLWAGTVALATSPISPLDPTIKKVIGWGFTVWGAVSSVSNLANYGTIPQGQGAVSYWKPLLMPESVATWAAEGAGWGRAALAMAAYEVATTALAWGVAYATSSWGTAGKYAVAFVARAFTMAAYTTSGPLGVIGATYDLAYTLKHPDGRVFDLSGGQGGESFTLYYHTGFEGTGFSFGRQHIRVGDPGGGFWELGDAKIGYFGPGLGWGGWVSTQKITVVLSPAQAASFRAALVAGSEGGGRYEGYRSDSYTYVSAALQFATGTSAADLHINPGLIHW